MEHGEIETETPEQDVVELGDAQTADANIIVKRMWPGGPLRRWSPSKCSGGIVYATGGYVLAYVCEDCRRALVGVYRVRVGADVVWVCRGCREKREPRREPEPLPDSTDAIQE